YNFLCFIILFFLCILEPPRSTLFPTRRSSDLRRKIVPVGLFGLPRKTSRVRGVTAAAIASRSCVKSRSGTTRLVPPAACTTSTRDRKSTRLNSSHVAISYAVFCLKKKNMQLEL